MLKSFYRVLKDTIPTVIVILISITLLNKYFGFEIKWDIVVLVIVVSLLTQTIVFTIKDKD